MIVQCWHFESNLHFDQPRHASKSPFFMMCPDCQIETDIWAETVNLLMKTARTILTLPPRKKKKRRHGLKVRFVFILDIGAGTCRIFYKSCWLVSGWVGWWVGGIWNCCCIFPHLPKIDVAACTLCHDDGLPAKAQPIANISTMEESEGIEQL